MTARAAENDTTYTCPAVINIEGQHYPCDWMNQMAPGSQGHEGWAHANSEAGAIWTSDPAFDGLARISSSPVWGSTDA